MAAITKTFIKSTIDFSVVGDSNPRLPKLSTGDAIWKAQVCENARKIYLSIKYSNRIQCVKESKARSPIADDDEDACDSPLSSAATCVEPEQQEAEQSEQVSKDKKVSSDLEAEMAQLQDKLKRMEERSRQLEDENSLLAWYAHHLRDTSGEPSPTVDSILEEAKTSVLEQALATIDEAAAIVDAE